MFGPQRGNNEYSETIITSVSQDQLLHKILFMYT